MNDLQKAVLLGNVEKVQNSYRRGGGERGVVDASLTGGHFREQR